MEPKLIENTQWVKKKHEEDPFTFAQKTHFNDPVADPAVMGPRQTHSGASASVLPHI